MSPPSCATAIRSIPKTALALFVSQSGETADTLAALRDAKAQGPDAPSRWSMSPKAPSRAKPTSCCRTYAGPEIGVASTKAFTCQLAVLASLRHRGGRGARPSQRRSRREAPLRLLLETPRHMVANSSSRNRRSKRWAEEIAKARDVLYLGRGVSYPLALEGALKLKEISYIHAEGYAAGEMKHGPIALIDENVPIIVIAPHDAHFEKTISNMQEVMARGGKVLLISDREGIAQAGKVWAQIEVPDDQRLHHAAALRDSGAAAGLLRRHRQRHRRRPAAQPRQIRHRGITLAVHRRRLAAAPVQISLRPGT